MMELRPASTEARALSTFGVRNDGSIPRTGRRRIGNVDPRTIRLVTALGTALVLSEAVTLALGPTVGLLAQALALSALLGLSMRQGSGPHQRLTLALALLPLVRILSLALPAAITPIVFWYLEIGLAAFEAILLVMRRLDTAISVGGLKWPYTEKGRESSRNLASPGGPGVTQFAPTS